MSIRRAPRPDSNFYMLDKSISEDTRLSWAARGLLIFLLGKPDHWEVSVQNLVNQTGECIGRPSKRDAVYALLKELEQAGYLARQRGRQEGGEFSKIDYIVTETPHTDNPEVVDSPYTDKPDTVEPDRVNPTQASIEGLVSIEGSPSTENHGGQEAKDAHHEIPEWLPDEQWGEFIEHRKQIKAKLTPLAKKKMINKLDALRQEGDDLKAVLDQSIANGWKGVFPTKTAGKGRQTQGRHSGLKQPDTSNLSINGDGTYEF